MNGKSRWFFVAALVAVMFVSVGSARANQIFVCQSCSSAPGGTLIGGEGNGITNPSSFDVGVVGTDDNPLLIVVALYNGNGSPSLSYSGSPVPVASLNTYGLTSTSLSITTGDPFHALGLTSGGSISFGNLSSTDSLNGYAAPSSFTLDVFEVPTALSGVISLDESGASGGSFILAYSCKTGAATDTACSSGNVSQTVNTNVGMLPGSSSPVPEPGSLALLGTGLLGAAGILRRRLLNS